jgi:hypothetical protein
MTLDGFDLGSNPNSHTHPLTNTFSNANRANRKRSEHALLLLITTRKLFQH